MVKKINITRGDVVYTKKKAHKITFNMPEDMYDALHHASAAGNISMTKYIIRLLYVSLMRDGFLQDKLVEHRVDIFMKN